MKDSLFNKWCRSDWISISKRMNLNLKLTPYTKINSKWIVSLNVICKTVRFLDKNRRDLCDLGLGKEFLDLAAKP